MKIVPGDKINIKEQAYRHIPEHLIPRTRPVKSESPDPGRIFPSMRVHSYIILLP